MFSSQAERPLTLWHMCECVPVCARKCDTFRWPTTSSHPDVVSAIRHTLSKNTNKIIIISIGEHPMAAAIVCVKLKLRTKCSLAEMAYKITIIFVIVTVCGCVCVCGAHAVKEQKFAHTEKLAPNFPRFEQNFPL